MILGRYGTVITSESVSVPTGRFCVEINMCDLSCVLVDGVIGFKVGV